MSEFNNNVKQDFIDRKVSGIERLFALVMQDARTFLLTLSILLNFWLVYLYVNNNKLMSDRIIEEVRRTAPYIIKKETDEQLKPTKDLIDTLASDLRKKLN